jgi:serine/alanine adding enzyme
MIDSYTLTTEDAETWQRILPADLRASASLEYVRICERQAGLTARLFVVEIDGCPVAAYPYFLRPLDSLPFAASMKSVWYDTTTPEYLGPVWIDPDMTPAAAPFRFPEVFADHCREKGIIAEFAHLDPWIPEQLLESGCVKPNREIVYVDLTWPEDDIWMKSLSSDARRQTKQGQRAGVQTRRATEPDDVREFHRLYAMTMERRQARESYRYPLEYFMAFFETMSGNSFFVLAEYEERVVAGGLFVYDDNEIRWHLSAADREWSRVRPVNVYLYNTIRESLGQRWKRMLLGGAYEDGDGVFRFKANFSRLRADFQTYERLHDVDAYAAVMTNWHRHYGSSLPREDYFPAYRASPPESDE